ncbi:MAG: IS66 family transposase, partial [Burkholderiales bacterium]
MTSTTARPVLSLAQAAALAPQQVVDLVGTLSREIDILKQQLDWFKRQVFGQKSERRLVDGASGQLS